MKSGTICVGAIEIIQPVFGQVFDINDIILNLIGLVTAATIFFGGEKSLNKESNINKFRYIELPSNKHRYTPM